MGRARIGWTEGAHTVKVRECPRCGAYNQDTAWYCARKGCGQVLSVDTVTEVGDGILLEGSIPSQNKVSHEIRIPQPSSPDSVTSTNAEQEIAYKTEESKSYEGSQKGLEIPHHWYDVWLSALFHPSVVTFEDIASGPKATWRRAYTWVFCSHVAGYGIGLVLNSIFTGVKLENPIDILLGEDPQGILNAFGILIGFIVSSIIAYWVARVLGGTASYSELAITFAAIHAPMGFIVDILAQIPIPNYLYSYLAPLYSTVLEVIAVKAVYQFGWGKATATVVLRLVAFVTILICGATCYAILA